MSKRTEKVIISIWTFSALSSIHRPMWSNGNRWDWFGCVRASCCSAHQSLKGENICPSLRDNWALTWIVWLVAAGRRFEMTATKLSQAIKVPIRMTDFPPFSSIRLLLCVSVQHILCCCLDVQPRVFPRPLSASHLTRGDSQLIGREWKRPLVWCPLTFRGS